MEEEQKPVDDTFEEFLKWAGDVGITDSKTNAKTTQSSSCLGHSLTIAYFPQAGGRGLGAVRDLRQGELVLRVPKPVLFTTESVSQDSIFCAAVHSFPNLSSTQILTVGLLYEAGKGKNSRWYLYLKHLPRSYETLATFGIFEMQALQVEDAIWTAEKAASKAESDWKEAWALMEELKFKRQLLSFKAWLWASATISTRALHIPWDTSGCLCPVGDLFNYDAPGGDQYIAEETDSHSSSTGASSEECLDDQSSDLQRLTDGGFEEDFNAYCFYARKNYKKGEQVLLSYGTYTNLELLEHYGFLLNGNPNDKVFIPFEPDVYALSSWPMDTMFIHQKGKPSYSMLSALRLWAVPPGQRKSIGHLVYSGNQLSLGNEMEVMGAIIKKCYALLERVPTLIEEDRMLLHAIDKMQDYLSYSDIRELSPSVQDEVHAILVANNARNAQSNLELHVPKKSRKSLERWKLAVEWRLSYKEILVDCISYCTKVIDSLSCLDNSNT